MHQNPCQSKTPTWIFLCQIDWMCLDDYEPNANLCIMVWMFDDYWNDHNKNWKKKKFQNKTNYFFPFKSNQFFYPILDVYSILMFESILSFDWISNRIVWLTPRWCFDDFSINLQYNNVVVAFAKLKKILQFILLFLFHNQKYQ